MFALLPRSTPIAGRRAALVPKRFVLGFVDGRLLARHELGLQGQKAFFGRQAQLQDLMAFAMAALGVVEIAAGPLDLAPGARLAGVIDDEGTLGAGPQLVGLLDAPGQGAGQAPPVDVLAAQEVVEHAHLAGQKLA